MSSEAIVTLGIALSSVITSWCVWVTLKIFKHAQELALIRQEMEMITEMRDTIKKIDAKLG